MTCGAYIYGARVSARSDVAGPEPRCEDPRSAHEVTLLSLSLSLCMGVCVCECMFISVMTFERSNLDGLVKHLFHSTRFLERALLATSDKCVNIFIHRIIHLFIIIIMADARAPAHTQHTTQTHNKCTH